jgi:hypothetical protein
MVAAKMYNDAIGRPRGYERLSVDPALPIELLDNKKPSREMI